MSSLSELAGSVNQARPTTGHPGARARPPRRHRSPHIEALRELAAAEAGYALLPEYTIRRDKELGRLVGLRAEGLDTALPVAIVGRRNQEMTPALKAVRKALHESEAQASPLRGREFES